VEEVLRRDFPALEKVPFVLFYSGMTKCELQTTTETIKIGMALQQDKSRPGEQVL
jgi:hypothetical protein